MVLLLLTLFLTVYLPYKLFKSLGSKFVDNKPKPNYTIHNHNITIVNNSHNHKHITVIDDQTKKAVLDLKG